MIGMVSFLDVLGDVLARKSEAKKIILHIFKKDRQKKRPLQFFISFCFRQRSELFSSSSLAMNKTVKVRVVCRCRYPYHRFCNLLKERVLYLHFLMNSDTHNNTLIIGYPLCGLLFYFFLSRSLVLITSFIL